jgi:predicted nucleic acid binding AN1-type Zn finger protein
MRCLICHKHVSISIGKCNACEKWFCVFHRLAEAHECKNLETIRNTASLKLRNQLMKEKT